MKTVYKNIEVKLLKINIYIKMSYTFRKRLQKKMKILLKVKKIQLGKILNNPKKINFHKMKSVLSIFKLKMISKNKKKK